MSVFTKRVVLKTILVSGLVLPGCNSSGDDVLDLKSSQQVTGSIGSGSSGRVVPSDSVGEQITQNQQPFPFNGEEQSAGNSAIAKVTTPSNTESAQAKPVQTASLKPSRVGRPSGVGRSSFKQKIYKQRFSDAKPINFGKYSPKPYQVHGVDVSRWQGDIDWLTLRKNGASFAYIKATDGGDHLDKKFKENWNAAAKAGIPRGAYHFFYWCRNAESQANWFIRNVPKTKGALPPVLDVEWNNHSKSCRTRPSRSMVLKKMKVFLTKLERHYGVKPIIYTAPDFYKDNLVGELKQYSFWLRSVAAHPKKVYKGRDFAFWQYSGTGLSKGVQTQIDLNVFNGTEKSWRRWLQQRTL